MFDFDKISVSKFYVAPSVERVVEFSPPGIDMQNITKVLSLAVDAKCNVVDVYDGYVQVGGRTSFRLTYLDREGAAKGVDYNADFTVRVDGDFCQDDSVSCEIKVVESDAQAGEALTLSAVLEVVALAHKHEDIEVLVDAENCYKTQKPMFLPAFVASKTVVLPFDDEKEVGGEIGSVLSMDTNVTVKKAKAIEGGAETQIDIYGVVTYVEGGEIKQKDFNISVDEEVALDGAMEGDSIAVQAAVKSSKIILQGVTDDNIIRVEGKLQIKVSAYRCSQIEVVGDLFMLTNEVEIERKEASYVCYDGVGFFSEHVSGTAVLGDNRAAVLSINALPYASCYTSKAYVDESGKLQVEGIVNTDIIYTDENGYNSVRTEIPFAVQIESKIPFSKYVKVHCSVESISAKAHKEREIDVELRLGVQVQGYSEVGGSYISAVELGEEKPQNKSALSMYIARGGDEILDLCKALTAMPEDIIAQNPSAKWPLERGEKIVYFRHIG